MSSYEKLIEDNLGLVPRVIRDKVYNANQIGMFTYDDLIQIGRVGLCKAARRYNPDDGKAKFDTYAYVAIRNEIFDALEYSSVRQKWESTEDFETVLSMMPATDDDTLGNKTGIEDLLRKIQEKTSGVVLKGIQAIKLHAEGQSFKDIGEAYGASANNVTAWVSKARKYLLSNPDILVLRDTI